MAKRIIHQLVDDLDGGVLEHDEGETVLFSIDGIAYEIDLSNAHAAALREALAGYVRAGRRVTASRSASTRRAAGETAAIRQWAAANGHAVSDRGRIPAPIVAEYHAAH
ncbi:Lsr2 family protein [Microbacterium sp. B2969]|uniref:Lsr2 family protein n=1 Tax=Microbacterium alkaliflavum TaxID=3248839 RepID=A0ABW7QG27_9MICO